MGKFFEAPQGFVKNVRYIDLGKKIIAAVYTSERCRAFVDHNGSRRSEMFNDREPFDFTTHHFTFEKGEISENKRFFVSFTPWRAGRGSFETLEDITTVELSFDEEKLISKKDELSRMDRKLLLIFSDSHNICEGVDYSIEHYTTADNAPVVVYVLKYDPSVAKMCTGTPNGTLDYRNQKQTVMDEAKYAISENKRVIAAFNADFFDMFGDCAPSGLCVKDGNIVANPDSKRYFFGTKRDNTHIIDTLSDHPMLLPELMDVVCGKDPIVIDGKIGDVAIGEPFGYIAHPRTVAGITNDGKVIIMIIDGRRPAYSNGATLVDAAKLLISHGAVSGLNLDGGGSSTFIVENASGELEMLNHPADLARPTEDLIRDVFNSILIVKK